MALVSERVDGLVTWTSVRGGVDSNHYNHYNHSNHHNHYNHYNQEAGHHMTS